MTSEDGEARPEKAPRDDERGARDSGGVSDGRAERSASDVPLDIAGHEERDPPGGSGPSGNGEAPDGTTIESTEEAPLVATNGAAAVEENGDRAAVDGEKAPDGADDDLAGAMPDSAVPDEDDEVEPVELLVQLAKRGEIDPWDIDIVGVTDAFLDALDAADLRTSGRALFYASVLLRMKSDAMLGQDDPPEPEPEPWELPPGEEPVPAGDPVDALEQEMERRLERKRARGKPETLDELVRELREAERTSSWWKESRTYDTSDSPRGFRRGTQTLDYRSGDERRVDDEPSEDDVTGAQHTEDIEAVIADVQAALTEQYDGGRDEVLYAEVQGVGGSRMSTYLALLFLAHRGHVRLEQDELFGDLWIQQPTVASGSDEAVAD